MTVNNTLKIGHTFRETLARYALWLGLIGSVSWFCYEYLQLPLWDPLPWVPGNGLRMVKAAAFTAILFVGLHFFMRRSVVAGLGLIAALLAAGAVGMSAILAVLILLFSASVLGRRIMAFVSLRHEDAFHVLLQLTLGLAVYAITIGLLALFPVNYAAVYLALLLLPIIIWPKFATETWTAFGAIFRLLNCFANGSPLQFLVILLFVALYLCVAMLPEMGFDALAMHLTIATQVAEQHRWGFDVARHIWAVLPMNGDWLYTLTYMLSGEYAARLTNLFLMLTLAALLTQAVRHWAGPKLTVLALLFLLSLPLTYLETSSLFIENALALFLFGALLCVLLFAESRKKGYLLLAAFLSGAALGTKLVAALFLAPLSLIILYYLFQPREPVRWLPLLLKCLAILLLIGSIPYVIAYVKTGNPVFPFYNTVFKSPFFNTESSFDNPLFKQGFHLLTLRDITFDSGKFLEGQIGSFGWVFFVLLPLTAVAALMSRARFALPLIIISLIFIALVFHSQSYLRYIYPAVPPLILVMALGIQHLANMSLLLGRTVMVTGAVLVGMNAAILPVAGWHYRDIDLRLLYSSSARDEFLFYRIPIRKAIEYVNVSEGSGARVGFFAPAMVAGLKGAALTANWYNPKLTDAVSAIHSESQLSDLVSLLKDNGISTIVLDENFNPGDESPFLVSMLKSVTVLERQFGHISVRTVRKELLFTEERLMNPDFESLEGWDIGNAVQYQPVLHTLIVTANDTASQAVKVSGGVDYQLSATVRCVTPGSMFRLQANWLGEKGEFLGTSLTPTVCSDDYQTYSQVVKSPEGAVIAVVYANGHSGEDRVEYNSLSFK